MQAGGSITRRGRLPPHGVVQLEQRAAEARVGRAGERAAGAVGGRKVVHGARGEGEVAVDQGVAPREGRPRALREDDRIAVALVLGAA